MNEAVISTNPVFTFDKWLDISDVDEDTDETAKILWKKEQSEFNQLKRLAHDLGVARVIVAPNPGNDFHGQYIYDELSTSWPEKWGLTSRQNTLTERFVTNGEAVIFIGYYAVFDQGACHILAHEIGHHIYQMARYAQQVPVSNMMSRFFPGPGDTYFHKNRDEICAECFAFYLTGAPFKKTIERHCDSILRRVRANDPKAANLIKSHRQNRVSNAFNH
jgi:hypothetical protein